ncbi:cytochrome c biogenesis protein [Sporomusa acidovorans]|uniref:Heme exporter protein C n=1 Tax=Sporomusa acidovorans (strain ATCC 49682 / DSM 3132 / Mol) TaxID=1123286 RepID=A0ABZ3JAG6_SPOA4|nr:cytochrome c biogenesis protein [Sporomusa acidovorans]OZC21790.1 heme exporter protein C [Sporomusa acidovorans DSM 3132]SDD56797.1 heme exporter protein C [Sporomusa acidovorans]
MKRSYLSIWGIGIWTVGVIYAVLTIIPPAEGLGNLVRIAFFHIPVAWVSVLAFLLSAVWAFQYLRTRQPEHDWKSSAAASLGFVFCILATVSGAIFAKLTWGAYWNWDPRQTTIFILLLIYGAYLALRSAIEDKEQKARIAAVYSLCSFITVPFLVFIIPRYYFSLHPAPVINSAAKVDMDWGMLIILIAALIACTAIFWWLLSCRVHSQCQYEAALLDGEEGLKQ